MIQYLFMIFGGLMLISRAILANNPVHSIFCFVFVNASAILILLDVEFLAIIFLIVYVGAVSILFLFVVMMFNIKLVELKTTRFIPIGMVIAVVFLWQSTALLENFSNINAVSTNPWFSDTRSLSSLISWIPEVVWLGIKVSFFLFFYICSLASMVVGAIAALNQSYTSIFSLLVYMILYIITFITIFTLLKVKVVGTPFTPIASSKFNLLTCNYISFWL